MELDIEEMFGIQGSRSRRDSYGSGSGGSGSEGEEEDDGGRNNLMEEALEVPGPESGAGRRTDAAAKPIKPKRVIKNPMPKLDAIRIAGPRGIPVIQKCFKKVKFQGKGHEKEDLEILMKHIEHWAHRLFPKLPFKDTVEQLEKLGMKKPVQIMMKRIRLDMFVENEMDGGDQDNVLRGTDDVEMNEPVVDVFDELLGQTDFPRAPLSSQPRIGGLTEEQKERLEQNRRIAEEKRLARLKEQEEHERLLEEMDVGNDIDQNEYPASSLLENLKTRELESKISSSRMDIEDEDMDNTQSSHTLTKDLISQNDNGEIHQFSNDISKTVDNIMPSSGDDVCLNKSKGIGENNLDEDYMNEKIVEKNAISCGNIVEDDDTSSKNKTCGDIKTDGIVNENSDVIESDISKSTLDKVSSDSQNDDDDIHMKISMTSHNKENASPANKNSDEQDGKDYQNSGSSELTKNDGKESALTVDDVLGMLDE